MAAIILAILISAGLLAWFVHLRARHRSLPVEFKTFDEWEMVSDVVRWAQDQIAADDPRRAALMSLWVAPRRPLPVYFARWPSAGLGALAPFIDRVIAGTGPPWPLPAEYDDRAEVLGAFKARMRAEGLWP